MHIKTVLVYITIVGEYKKLGYECKKIIINAVVVIVIYSYCKCNTPQKVSY